MAGVAPAGGPSPMGSPRTAAAGAACSRPAPAAGCHASPTTRSRCPFSAAKGRAVPGSNSRTTGPQLPLATTLPSGASAQQESGRSSAEMESSGRAPRAARSSAPAAASSAAAVAPPPPPPPPAASAASRAAARAKLKAAARARHAASASLPGV